MINADGTELNLVKLYVQQHPIECMFFSEFHHVQGPKITFQVVQIIGAILQGLQVTRVQ